MNKNLLKPILPFIFLGCFAFACGTQKEERITSNGPEKVDFKVLPFEIKDVKLLDGPFKHATDLNIQSLLNYEPDRFLAKFRSEAG